MSLFFKKKVKNPSNFLFIFIFFCQYVFFLWWNCQYVFYKSILYYWRNISNGDYIISLRSSDDIPKLITINPRVLVSFNVQYHTHNTNSNKIIHLTYTFVAISSTMRSQQQHFTAAVAAIVLTASFAYYNNNCGFKPSDDDDAETRLQLVVAKYEVVPIENAVGPESFAFDPRGEGPYSGVSDGRIIKWDTLQKRWLNFALTSSSHRCTHFFSLFLLLYNFTRDQMAAGKRINIKVILIILSMGST